MYELKKVGKVFTSKFVGTAPSSYKKKRIYRAAVSQSLRNTGLVYPWGKSHSYTLYRRGRRVSDQSPIWVQNTNSLLEIATGSCSPSPKLTLLTVINPLHHLSAFPTTGDKLSNTIKNQGDRLLDVLTTLNQVLNFYGAGNDAKTIKLWAETYMWWGGSRYISR